MSVDTKLALQAYLQHPRNGGWRGVLQSGSHSEVQETLVKLVSNGCTQSPLPVHRSALSSILLGEEHLNDYDLLLLLKGSF